MPSNVIANSSALVALLRRDNQHHQWIIAQVNFLPPPWLICEAVLTETFHLVGQPGAPKIKEMLRRRTVALAFDLDSDLAKALALMEKYADAPMSLADACLVRMSETMPDPVVVTTDADFKIYRRHSRQVIPRLRP